MARFREHILKWGNKYDGPNNYKDGRRGGAEDAFWDENELVDHRRSGSKSRRPKRGCPGNDGKAHVYVWIPYEAHYGYEWITPDKYEVKVCCGCNIRAQKSLRTKKT